MPRRDDQTRACDLFAARFSFEPSRVAWAPGRVNLIGDHVDYQGGLVFPMAIRLGCACAAGPGAVPGRLRIVSTGFDAVWEGDAVDALTPGLGVGVGHWASYAAGVVAEISAIAGRAGEGVDLALASSVPIGSGLSSSAAVEVSVATALAGLWGLDLQPLELARLCQRAEHRFAGTPCGLMDQATAVLGREGHAVLLDCRSESADWVRIPVAARWFVVDTRVRHRLADGAYADRRAAAERAAAALGVGSLREIPTGGLPATLRKSDQEAYDAAAHIVSEIGRVEAAAEALRAGDLPAFGALMDASHASLRDRYRVSCDELDAVVRAAGRVPGVLGARMTGGGFGGCAVVLVDGDRAGGFADRLLAGLVGAGWPSQEMPAVFEVRASGGAIGGGRRPPPAGGM